MNTKTLHTNHRTLPIPYIALLFILLPLLPWSASAAPGFEAITIQPAENGAQTYTVSIQVIALMTAFTFIPAFLLLMTSFTRIIIVLSFMRQAMGTMQTPSNQILVSMALILTFYIMGPVFDQIHDDAIQPYLAEKLTMMEAIEKAGVPLRVYMLKQTRDTDLSLFTRLSGNEEGFENANDIPFKVLIPSYVISELKTAFQIGFLIFIPFLIIDLVVASTLMSMGMMMLSPMMISLPFKLMLFVMIDGWSLLIGTLTQSFYLNI